MVEIIIAAASVVTLGGAYLYWRGERLLDRVIEFQKRHRGGFYRKIDPNAQCPSCGAKQGSIVWNPELERVVHQCHVDGATWCEKPRIPAQVWDILGKQIKYDRENAEDIKAVFARANAPIKLKEAPPEAAN